MKYDNFHKIIIPSKSNLFHELSTSVDFESTGKGRLGNHLVDVNNKGVPIVRTTTKYNIAAHRFSALHHNLIQEINDVIKIDKLNDLEQLHFNNALIEIYDKNYKKMKYHSDQCLDIDMDSYFGLFSCYEKPEELEEEFIRKLKIKNKETGTEFTIPLSHNSVVLFSFSSNTKFLHKIILEAITNKKRLEFDNRWLGITFRKSKSFIQFKDDMPYFPDGKLLTIADDNQKKEFFKLRGQENNELDFVYPKLSYTLSLADTMKPKD